MHLTTLSGKHVLVMGLGISGRSAVQFLLFHQAIVQGIDRDANVLNTHPEIQLLKKAGLTVQLEKDFHDFTKIELLVLSPGVPQNHPIVQTAKSKEIPIIGEIALGCQTCKNPMVGITGTNGKTTVTLLIAHILNQCGLPARALGNVGIPLTKELLNIAPEEIISLELSSYQIETLYLPCLDAALLLNITPDHLDRYGTMESYAKAKCVIERCLKPGGRLYIEERTWINFGHLLKEKNPLLYGYMETSAIYTDLNSVYREGKIAFDLPKHLKNNRSHDLENLLAAFAFCAEMKIDGHAFIDAYQSFKKPKHRIEFVIEHQGIRFYDDSKGTNIDAVIRAVQSLHGSIILIAGGVDKGSSYTPWLEEFKNKVKSICAIGQAAAKIHDQLASHVPVAIYVSLEEAVQAAAREAEVGDIVLLSPGCSSYDMFKDYAHRGQEFQRIVRDLDLFSGTVKSF